MSDVSKDSAHSKTQTSIGLSSYKPMNIMNYKTTKTMNKNESLAELQKATEDRKTEVRK